MNRNGRMKVSLVQLSSQIGDVESNAKEHIEILDRLKKERTDVVAFPELSLTGYLLKDVAYEVPSRCESALKAIASSTGRGRSYVVVGYVRKKRAGLIQNAAAVLNKGRLVGSVPKFYLPTYGLFEEMRYFTPGDPRRDLRVFRAGRVKFGVIICEDAWHAEPIEALARMGADVVFCIASSPARGIHHANPKGELPIEMQWKSLLSAHALMNNVFLVFVNRAGAEDEEYFWGGSMVASPSGEIIASAKKYENDLLTIDLDLSEVERTRRLSSFKDHKAAFHKVLESL
jgi:NAD+ synthase (glutamine-hydrolysing)